MKSIIAVTILLSLFAVMFAGFVIPAIQPYSIAATIALMVIAVVFTLASMADHKAIVDHLNEKK